MEKTLAPERLGAPGHRRHAELVGGRARRVEECLGAPAVVAAAALEEQRGVLKLCHGNPGTGAHPGVGSQGAEHPPGQ